MAERTSLEHAKPPAFTPSPMRIARREIGSQTHAVPDSVREVLGRSGQALDATTRADMERRFDHDFSKVRIHADGRAAESAHAIQAQAFTYGQNIVFGEGQYAPSSHAGKQLLAHELAHTIQQSGATASGSPTLARSEPHEREAARAEQTLGARDLTTTPVAIQRREFPAADPSAQLGTRDWLTMDRVNQSANWQTSCLLNLVAGRSHEYTQPHERRDFYLWVYNYTSGLGFGTRWPVAAYIVAGGAAHLAYGSPFENDVQVAARRGNQIIFDDVFPKLRALVTGPVLRGAAAQAWDARTLSEEQSMIQSMYSSTPTATVDRFAGYAAQRGVLATLGGIAGQTAPQRGGQYHRVLSTPAFAGNIRSVDDRFDYGISLADRFSTHPATGRVSRPAVGPTYTSGAEFTRQDTRIHLHELDAELDDTNVDEQAVIRIMQTLTVDEQQELGYNILRLDFMRNALNSEEMARALHGLTSIPASVRSRLTQ
ncbi:MAG: DUF4157 domain-containing protein [Fimbriimonas sp.]